MIDLENQGRIIAFYTYRFVADCSSTNSANFIKVVWNWFSLFLAYAFIENKTHLISLFIDIAYEKDPIARDNKFARRKNSYVICMYSKVTAIEYPIGFFVSNGNLHMGNIRKVNYFSRSIESYILLYHIGTGNTKESLPKSVVK